MTNDDENNKPSRKIQIFNNKDGTYNRKDFVDDELVNEEFIDHRSQHNYGKSALRDFLENLNGQGLPDGWRQTPLGKQAYQIGHKDGWCEGYEKAMEENQKTLDTIRHLLDLENQRCSCE